MRVSNNIIRPIARGIETITDSSLHSANVARRASRIHEAGSVRTKIAAGTGYVSGAVQPVVNGLSNCSDSIGVITDTIKKVSRKMRASKNTALSEDPKASALKAGMKGLKQATPELKSALKEITGVNDIKAAKKEKGTITGVKETAKAAARVSLSSLLYVAGSFIPVPGTGLAGYILGEKVVNTVLGKPFTKIASKIKKS